MRSRQLRDVHRQPGENRYFRTGLVLPREDGLDAFARPNDVADEVVADEDELRDARGVVLVELANDDRRVFVVRVVVPRQDAHVAEFAEKRAASRDLNRRPVILGGAFPKEIEAHRQRATEGEPLPSNDPR